MQRGSWRNGIRVCERAVLQRSEIGAQRHVLDEEKLRPGHEARESGKLLFDLSAADHPVQFRIVEDEILAREKVNLLSLGPHTIKSKIDPLRERRRQFPSVLDRNRTGRCAAVP